MPCRATQERWVLMKCSDKTWSTGEGNGKLLQYSCLKNSMDSMKRQKDMALESEPLVRVGVEWRAITNSSRKNEAAGPKWKQRSFLGVSGGESKVWHCKEQYFLGTWNVRSMNQGELDVVKQEVARVFYNGILIFWRRKYQPTSVLLPGKFHGWRSLVGYSPWDCKESDTTEQLHWFTGKYLTIWRHVLPVPAPTTLSTECLISALHPELLSGGVEGQQLQQHVIW